MTFFLLKNLRNRSVVGFAMPYSEKPPSAFTETNLHYPQQYLPTFDDVILNSMPLLKHGITPEQQTILDVLEQIAVGTGHDRWRLKVDQQRSLL